MISHLLQLYQTQLGLTEEHKLQECSPACELFEVEMMHTEPAHGSKSQMLLLASPAHLSPHWEDCHKYSTSWKVWCQHSDPSELPLITVKG